MISRNYTRILNTFELLPYKRHDYYSILWVIVIFCSVINRNIFSLNLKFYSGFYYLLSMTKKLNFFDFPYNEGSCSSWKILVICLLQRCEARQIFLKISYFFQHDHYIDSILKVFLIDRNIRTRKNYTEGLLLDRNVSSSLYNVGW